MQFILGYMIETDMNAVSDCISIEHKLIHVGPTCLYILKQKSLVYGGTEVTYATLYLYCGHNLLT